MAREAGGEATYVRTDVTVESEVASLVEATEETSDLTLGTNVNESSFAGLKGIPDNALYTASKHAVIGLTRTAALENAGTGIRVNAASPSAIDGAMLRGFMTHRGFSEEKMSSLVPVGRIGKPEDAAEAVLFLCSDRASYIIGTTLEVDGGMSAGRWVGPAGRA